jgi:hypothetical protein
MTRGRSQPSCLARHVVVRCPSPGARPLRQTLAARRPAGGRQGWPAARLMLRCGGGLPVAPGETDTPWRVHQREQGGTGWAGRGQWKRRLNFLYPQSAITRDKSDFVKLWTWSATRRATRG